MKKIFVILALVGMSASVSATVIATATNNVAVTSNLGDKDKKLKKIKNLVNKEKANVVQKMAKRKLVVLKKQSS